LWLLPFRLRRLYALRVRFQDPRQQGSRRRRKAVTEEDVVLGVRERTEHEIRQLNTAVRRAANPDSQTMELLLHTTTAGTA
jgi:hypothetical protein